MARTKGTARPRAGDDACVSSGEKVDMVLTDEGTGFGPRGKVVPVPLDAAAELETAHRARRATERDRALAGV